MRRLEILIEAGPEYCELCGFQKKDRCRLFEEKLFIKDEGEGFSRDENCLNSDKGAVR